MIIFALWQRETEVQTGHSPDLPRHSPEPPAPTGGWRVPKGKAEQGRAGQRSPNCGCIPRDAAEAGGKGGSNRLLGPRGGSRGRGAPSGAGAVTAAPRAGEQRVPLGHRAAGRAGEQRRPPRVPGGAGSGQGPADVCLHEQKYLLFGYPRFSPPRPPPRFSSSLPPPFSQEGWKQPRANRGTVRSWDFGMQMSHRRANDSRSSTLSGFQAASLMSFRKASLGGDCP